MVSQHQHFQRPSLGQRTGDFEDLTDQPQLGAAFVKGLQGDHPHYLKVVATPKHFAAHRQTMRHHFDAEVASKT